MIRKKHSRVSHHGLRKTGRLFQLFTTICAIFSVCRTVSAQEESPKESAQLEVKAATAADIEAVRDELLAEISKIKGESEAIQKENQELKARLDWETASEEANIEFNEDLVERLEALEDAEFERIRDADQDLKVYGFADVQWYKFLAKKSSMYNGSLNRNNSFAVGHWHLYLEKRLGDHFRFLGETRFLFQPYAEELSYEMEFAGESTSFERTYTKSTDWVDAYFFDWGGISIQRLWVEYKLNDMFGIRVGNYLTPYGIWNVDHASTVVIPAHRPFLITAQLMPESQTGIDIYGRFFLRDDLSLDYALTLSNGRGPTAKLYDLDENKAIGLNLSMAFDGPVSVSGGGYLFMGEYTDIVRVIELDPITFAQDWKERTVVNYLEKSMAFYLKFQAAGFLLQGEYVRGLIRYKKNGREEVYGYYYPDYIQQGSYVLFAYNIPKINLKPYNIYEYQEPSDSSFLPIGHNVGWGVNWQIQPTVCLKLEGFIHLQTVHRNGIKPSNLHYGVVSTQLAVSY